MTSSDRPLVMSIEDNRDTQQLIERLLSSRGYDVVIADNGLKGITLLTSNGTKPDIGYKGRIGTHEIFIPDDDVRLGISKGTLTAENLKRIGVERLGMTTLYWDAMEKVRNGVTTVEDVLAKIRKDEFDSRPAWMFEQYQMKPPTYCSKPLI